MMNKQITGLRTELEQLDTQTLDRMLHDAVHAQPLDGERAKQILSVLEEREKDEPVVITQEAEAAWQAYLRNIEGRKEGRFRWAPLLKAASIVLILGVLFFSITQEAEARSFFQRLTQWTATVFDMFSPGNEAVDHDVYVFQTEHPGLQQIHDAVTELGVTAPVVPMWIPPEYELVECKLVTTKVSNGLTGEFLWGNNRLVYKMDWYVRDAPNSYQKDETVVNIIEIMDTEHYIMRNKDAWVVAWTQENMECSIAVACHEDVLRRILTSIYTMEEEQ